MASSPSSSPLSPIRLTFHGLTSRVSSFRFNVRFFPRSENAERVSPLPRPVITLGATRSEPSRESNGGSITSSRDGSDGGSSPFFTSPTGLSSETRTAGSATAERQDAVVPRSGSDPIDRDLERGTTGGNPRTVEQQPLDFTHSISSVAATCLGTALSATLLVANKGGLPKAVFAAGVSGTIFSLGAAGFGLIYGCRYREEPAASTWMKRIAYSALCLSMLCSAGLVWASVVVN